MEVAQSGARKASNSLTCHLVDSTALLVESTPVFAFFETRIAGMSNTVSINARLFAAGLTYLAGTGYIYAKGRDLSRRLFKIKDDTTERLQVLHDAAYLSAFNLVVAPLIYGASGARNIKQIAIGTATAMGFGLINGGLMGYAVDLFRDLTGLKECNRPSYPGVLRHKNPRIKQGLAILLTVGALAITVGIYAVRK
jgi:hypothetical protein